MSNLEEILLFLYASKNAPLVTMILTVLVAVYIVAACIFS